MTGAQRVREEEGVTYRAAEVVRPGTYITGDDLRDWGSVARGAPEVEAELLALQASHPRLQEVPPAALALLGLHFAFRSETRGDDGTPKASPGFQISRAQWEAITGYSRRSLNYGFRWLVDAGLLERWPVLVTAEHLTRNREESERFTHWRSGRKTYRRVQLFSVTYLTQAGAELLERCGFDAFPSGTRSKRKGWHRAGWLGRLTRLAARLWRVLRRRFEARGAVAAGASTACTPLPAKQVEAFNRAQPSSHASTPADRESGAESPPTGATSVGCASAKPEATTLEGETARKVGAYGASKEGASAELEGTPPPVAMERTWKSRLGLTAEGIAAGLSWEGGGLLAYAETVERCWSRTLDTVRVAPADEPSPSRGWYEERRAWRCRGCGAVPPLYRDGVNQLRHAPDCPAVGTWRVSRARPRTTWAPALTAADAWPEDWAVHPEFRERLRRLFVPVEQELARRLRARAEELRREDSARLLLQEELAVWASGRSDAQESGRLGVQAPGGRGVVDEGWECRAGAPPGPLGRPPVCLCPKCIPVGGRS